MISKYEQALRGFAVPKIPEKAPGRFPPGKNMFGVSREVFVVR